MAEVEPRVKNVTQYRAWATRNKLGEQFGARDEGYYKAVLQASQSVIQQSPVWQSMPRQAREWSDKYKVRTGAQLFAVEPDFRLLEKEYSKAIEKNVLNNENVFPNPPPGGWVTNDNWFSRLGDLLRFQMVVRFIDGIDVVMEGLEALATEGNHAISFERLSKMDGYYACHANLWFDTLVPGRDWIPIPLRISVEIQIRTNMQEALWLLTHKFYEQERVKSAVTGPVAWQYEKAPDQFDCAYMAHLVHFVDAQVCRMREKAK